MIELNKIYCENCLDTMAKMPDDFIDLTVTSPPYDNLRDYNGYEFDFESIAKELFRITKKGGVVVWVVGDATIKGSETGTSFRQALYFKEIGFNLHDTMIYAKENPMPAQLDGNRYSNSFEYMFVLCKSNIKTHNLVTTTTTTTTTQAKRYFYQKDGSKILSTKDTNNKKVIENIWYFGVGYNNNDDKTYHPASYPEKLVLRHIYSWSNEGDLVYDPFMGSGTTAKAAHLLKRKWIGSEISQEYVDLANKRLKKYLDQITLF